MGRAELQNFVARFRRSTLVKGGGNSTETSEVAVGNASVSFSGVTVDPIDDAVRGGAGLVNALVVLAVNTAAIVR